MKSHHLHRAKILILGESNSVYRDGWVAGLAQQLEEFFIVENKSLGSSGIFNALFQLIRLGDGIRQYSHVVIDSSIQDATFYQHRTAAYFELIASLLDYLQQLPLSITILQFEPCQQTALESAFHQQLESFYKTRQLHFFRVKTWLRQENPNQCDIAEHYSDNHHIKRSVAYQLGRKIGDIIESNDEKSPILTRDPATNNSKIQDYFNLLDADGILRHAPQASTYQLKQVSTSLIHATTIKFGVMTCSIDIDPALFNHQIIGIIFNAPTSNGILDIRSANAVSKNLSNSTKKQWGDTLVWARSLHTPIRLHHQLHLRVFAQATSIENTEYCHVTDFQSELEPSVDVLGFIIKAPSRSRSIDLQALTDRTHTKLTVSGRQIIADLFSGAQWDEVIQLTDEIVNRLPREHFAWKVLGAALLQKGQHSSAIAAMRQSLQMAPNDPELHNNLAAALQTQAELSAAESHFHTAISLKPNYFEALFNLGDFYFHQQRYSQAEYFLQQALMIRSNFEEAQTKYAISLHHQKKFDAAKQVFEERLQANPTSHETHCNLANTYRSLGQTKQAEQHYRLALDLHANYVDAISNLSNLLSEVGRYSEAEEYSQLALNIHPKHPGALNNRALALRGQHRLLEAEQCLRLLLDREPDSEEAKINLAYILFMLGQYEEAWQLHEARFHPNNRNRIFQPASGLGRLWQGESLQGKQLLLWPEQGIGDQIQFIRYLDLLKAQHAKHIVIYCIKALEHLFSALCDDGVSIIVQGSPIPAHDFWVPLLSLPLHCKTNLTNVPARIPYLKANPILTAQFQAQLESIDAMKIGICWAGSSRYKHDAERSIGIASFLPLASLPHIQLFTLQANSRELFLQTFAESAYDLGHEIDAHCAAFEETAALISNLDLVITCDTSIGHLAGALGKPVWLMLPYVADWRWLTMRDDSPWYPNTRLFRQDESRNWDPVFKRIISTLTTHPSYVRVSPHLVLSPELITDNSTYVQTPISFGEFFDKLSILELKSRRITERHKRLNIVRELTLLRNQVPSFFGENQELCTLRQQLDIVNERIWDVEDDIRACEKRRDFGSHFIALARAVYINNDQRALLKHKINLLTKSSLIEEKSHIFEANHVHENAADSNGTR